MQLIQVENEWAERFETERLRLVTRFPHAFVDIQHIGSTSVPGVSARPVVDLLAGVPSMAIVDPLIASLCRFGYHTSARLNLALPGRRLLVRRVHSRSSHHLHLVVHGGPQWQQRLEFRDALRQTEQIRRAYDEIKLRWGDRYYGRRLQYSQAKSSFITTVLQHA
jgi:GrpB-like predicted nucleotidyltransferase (UPF0157 family)